MEFYTKVHRDAVAHFIGKLTNEILNSQYVGVISGQLRRSFDPKPLDLFRTAMVHDPSVAPYAIYVLDWSEARYGKNFIQIAIDLHWPGMIFFMKEEHKRMLSVISKANIYKYKNPFDTLN